MYITTTKQNNLLIKLAELQKDVIFLQKAILDGKTNTIQERLINEGIDIFNKTISHQ